ncbi:MAG: hypothetical protein WD607_10310 [Candidatus Paceibacterota bacterium]
MSQKKDDKKKLIFSLKNFKIIEYNSKIPKNPPHEFGYDINFEIKYRKKNKEFIVIINVVARKSKKSNYKYIDTTTETIVDIKNADEFKIVPLNFSAKMVSSAFSTTRGVIIGKNENNFLSKVPLPFLDLEEMKKILIDQNNK